MSPPLAMSFVRRRTRGARLETGYRVGASGYQVHMVDDSRNVEQELASGEDETTPVIALSSVIIVIACLVAVAVALAAIAYALA
jgi:hypothetical protein